MDRPSRTDIALPAAETAADLASMGEAAPRILVVDDNRDYREAVRFLLEQDGCEVLEAVNGAEGLARALEERPQLVLLDFNMPSMNGYELLQELRSSFELRRIPVIMLTGTSHRAHLKEMELNVADFLEKPVSNAELLDSVHRALGRSPARKALLSGSPEADEVLIDSGVQDKEEEKESGLELLDSDSPLIKHVNDILVQAVRLGASDVHIEPQEKCINVRVRLEGSLNPLCTFPASLAARLSARIKIMSNLVITERRRPQDGQFRIETAGRKIEFRVSVLPSAYGEKIVLRVLGSSTIKGSLAEIGFNRRDRECVERAMQSPHGMILVTGPTGSGKTTTLYTMIGVLNRPDVNVMTAEDPVEYRLPGITQIQVKPDIGFTFEKVLRAFLRQDPDIMLIGEMRDLETCEIAVKASITGHLVLSTLHTNSAPAAIARLTHMGIAPFLIAEGVRIVIAQRLVKLLCPRCKLRAPLSDEEKGLLSEQEIAEVKESYRGVGCEACRQTGYSGRAPVFEVMPIRTPAMRRLIVSSRDADLLTDLAVDEGMSTLRRSALALAAAGETALGQALKVAPAE